MAVNLCEREAFQIEARLINLLASELDNIALPPWPRGEVERHESEMDLPSHMTGDELRAWREARGISRAEAARMLALSVRGLQDQELGTRKVSAQTERLILLWNMVARLERSLLKEVGEVTKP